MVCRSPALRWRRATPVQERTTTTRCRQHKQAQLHCRVVRQARSPCHPPHRQRFRRGRRRHLLDRYIRTGTRNTSSSEFIFSCDDGYAVRSSQCAADLQQRMAVVCCCGATNRPPLSLSTIARSISYLVPRSLSVPRRGFRAFLALLRFPT